MSGYFARLAQRSDIAPAVIAPRAPAAFAHSDGDALEQHSEVIVTAPQDTAVTVSGPAPTASPPAGAKTVASSSSAPSSSAPSSSAPSSSAPPDPSPAEEAGMALPPSAPAPQASVHRAPRIVTTAAAHSAGPEAYPPASAADYSAPASTQGGDQAQLMPSVFAVTASHKLHKEIPATRRASAGSVARHHDAATHMRAGEHVDPRSSRDASATSSSTIPGTDDASSTRPTSRAMPILRTGAQSTQPAVAATRAQLQVHIGRIELEVHQPSLLFASPAAAPPPAQPVDPAGRSASFNPHRYYLRGSW